MDRKIYNEIYYEFVTKPKRPYLRRQIKDLDIDNNFKKERIKKEINVEKKFNIKIDMKKIYMEI
jgi:hypothetical protein